MKIRKLPFLLMALLLAFAVILGACDNGDGGEIDDETCGDFTLVAPSDEETGVDTVAQFEWTASKNALKYAFTISKNSDFTGGESELYVRQNIASPYFTLTEFELEYDTTYYWKVEAIGRGDGNKKVASNAPYSFTTRGDDNIEMSVNHLSYLSGDSVQFSFTVPASAENVSLCVTKDKFFSDESQEILNEQISGESYSLSKSGLSGKYYARLTAQVRGSAANSNEVEFFIGDVYKLHDFSSESGGDSGYNSQVRLFNGSQMSYSLDDGALKIQYTIGSYLDYTIIDFNDDLKSVVQDSAYFFIRYKCEAYLGYFLCKMRGDNSIESNWKDYYINNIPGDNEWRER